MNSEELNAVRVEMRNRLTVLMKNLLDLDRFNELASNLAPDLDTAEYWRKFARGDMAFGDSCGWSVTDDDAGYFVTGPQFKPRFDALPKPVL